MDTNGFLNKTKLAVFDLDGTLLDTPLPETGRKIYQEKTGKPWPYQGWWGREESLDSSIFDLKTIASVMTDYKTEKSKKDTAVIMLTGRISKLAPQVKAILDEKGYSFDGYYYNNGGRTDAEKIKTLNMLLDKHPTIEFVEMWDDRLEHIPVFEQWGKTKVEEGRLKDFQVNVVLSNHH
jgi:FMN phosphatase YigB (HAD superfamily)